MNSPSEEIPEDGNHRRKSIGTPSSLFGGSGSGGNGSKLAAGKTRRYSIGITSSWKSNGEEGNIVPNYLRASTGSCHDFCKYGKSHEHSKSSSVPIKFIRSTVVNKEKVTRTAVSAERKKTTMVTKPNPLTDPKTRTRVESIKVSQNDVSVPSKKAQVLKQSFLPNGKATENELKLLHRSTSDLKSNSAGLKKTNDMKTVKKTGITPNMAVVKKVVTKSIPNESRSPKASFSRGTNLKTIKDRGAKQVSQLKDQNRMQITKPKKTTVNKVLEKALQGGDAESEAKPATLEFGFSHPTNAITQSMESVNASISDGLESCSDKNVVEEASIILHPVELIPDKELSIALPLVESSQSSSDKEVLEEDSLLTPPVSESSQSFYDDEVLEDEYEYFDEEVEVLEEESEATDDEKVLVSARNEDDVLEISVEDGGKILRKGRMVISEDKGNEAVKLRFRRGKILDLQSENKGPRRLKFRRRVIERNEDGEVVAKRTFKDNSTDVQTVIHGSRRLKFSKGEVMEGKETTNRVARRTFEKKTVKETSDSNQGPESVVLKHQGGQGKKDSQGLFNNVIEETASKLVESRKSKVKALVGAFETVISLQDGKPAST